MPNDRGSDTIETTIPARMSFFQYLRPFMPLQGISSVVSGGALTALNEVSTAAATAAGLVIVFIAISVSVPAEEMLLPAFW
jgi:hypothetical protein